MVSVSSFRKRHIYKIKFVIRYRLNFVIDKVRSAVLPTTKIACVLIQAVPSRQMAPKLVQPHKRKEVNKLVKLELSVYNIID